MARGTSLGGLKVEVADGGRSLVLRRPPHPSSTFLLVLFAAAAVGLGAWFAGSGVEVACTRADDVCTVLTPGGHHLTLRLSDLASVRVEDVPHQRGRRRLVAVARDEKEVPLASTPLLREAELRATADALGGFLREPTPALHLSFRSWRLGLELATPFALLALLIAVFRRRHFRVTLKIDQSDLAVRRQTLLTSAHAPTLPRTARLDVDQADGPTPDSRRLVLRLPDGRDFPLTPWTEHASELDALQRQIEGFVRGG